MKVTRITAAALTVCAAFALAAGTAGAATASPAGKPKHSKPAASAPQVTGRTLLAGLLAGPDFGDGFVTLEHSGSGGKLLPSRALHTPAGLSCASFEGVPYNSGFGNTAGASGFAFNQALAQQAYGGVMFYMQEVLQFSSARAAARYYQQAMEKYASCDSFNEPVPFDHTLGTFIITKLSFATSTPGRYQMFTVTNSTALAASGNGATQDIAVALAGPNVYAMTNESTNGDLSSPTLLAKLITQVQQQYPGR